MPNSQIIILAAGSGTRMKADLPKVLHLVHGKTMLERVLCSALQVSEHIVLVVSHHLLKYLENSEYNDLNKFIDNLNLKKIVQLEQKGTGHALFVTLPEIDSGKNTIVLYADNPLLTSDIIKALENKLITTNVALVNLVFETDNPGTYGRIITDENKKFIKIVEFKEANEQEKAITLCNSGVVAFGKGILDKYMTPEWVNSKQATNKEVYLTDMVELLVSYKEPVDYLITYNSELAVGVNTQEELLAANSNFDNYLAN